MAEKPDHIMVYSNNGLTLFPAVGTNDCTNLTIVVKDGLVNANGNYFYKYDGDLKFVGVSLTPNAIEPTYKIGETFILNPNNVSNLNKVYIVESLEDTTWYVPRGWSTEDQQGFYKVKCNVSSDEIVFGGNGIHIGYLGNAIAVYSNNGYDIAGRFNNTSVFTLTITGGTDATNSDLISWLSEWGRVQETYELSGTWMFNKTVGDGQPASMYTYDINFISNGISFRTISFHADMTLDTNGLFYDDTRVVNVRSSSQSYFDEWVDESYRLIEFIDDALVDGAFYDWFTANAVKQEEPEITIPEGEHGEIYYKGKLIAVLTEGQTVTLHTEGFKAVEDIVIKYPSPKIITFYINNREFKALDGMTWEDWVANTNYNTDGCYCYENDNYVYCNGRIIYDDYLNSVKKMDKIISGHKYQFDTSGGGSN